MTLVRRFMMTIVIETILFRRLQAVGILHHLLIVADFVLWVLPSRRDDTSHSALRLTNSPVVTYPLHLIARIDRSRLALSFLIEYASSLACPTRHVRTSIFFTFIFMIPIYWQCALFAIALRARSIIRLLIGRWWWFAGLHPETLWRRCTSTNTKSFQLIGNIGYRVIVGLVLRLAPLLHVIRLVTTFNPLSSSLISSILFLSYRILTHYFVHNKEVSNNIFLIIKPRMSEGFTRVRPLVRIRPQHLC